MKIEDPYKGIIRAARALVGWSAADLAEKAGVSLETVRDMEAAEEVTPEAFEAVKAALAKGGTVYVGERDGGGPGVRLSEKEARRLRWSEFSSKKT